MSIKEPYEVCIISGKVVTGKENDLVSTAGRIPVQTRQIGPRKADTRLCKDKVGKFIMTLAL